MIANDNNITKLRKIAYELRLDVIDMIHCGGSGHPGGSLSMAEIIAVLYWKVLNIDPGNPKWENRDRIVLSKGHACPVLYAALAKKGFFDKKELKTLRKIDCILQGHPCSLKIPGLDSSTGSLGQGLSISVGMALGGKQLKNDFNVYAILSDGELQEGMIWEAAMSAGNFGLNNLTAIVDYNNLQVDGFINEVMNIEPLAEKWEAFGWEVLTARGNDVVSVLDAFNKRKNILSKPVVIICKTIKGKGVSYMENVMEWHASPISKELYDRAMNELKNTIDKFDNELLSRY